jgi:hypothetical protein
MKFTNEELINIRELTRRLLFFGEVMFFIFRLLDPAVSFRDWQIVLVSLTAMFIAVEILVEKYR